MAPRQLENKSSMPQACEGLCPRLNTPRVRVNGRRAGCLLLSLTCCGSKRSFYWRLWEVFLFGDHLSHTTKLDRFSLGNALLNIYLCMTTKEWGLDASHWMTMGCDDGMMTKKGCQKDADGTKTARRWHDNGSIITTMWWQWYTVAHVFGLAGSWIKQTRC